MPEHSFSYHFGPTATALSLTTPPPLVLFRCSYFVSFLVRFVFSETVCLACHTDSVPPSYYLHRTKWFMLCR